jgi:TonB family protein
MLKRFFVVIGFVGLSLVSDAFAARTRSAAVVSGKELFQLFIHPRAPEYPFEAQRNGWSGRGVYRASVTADGKVSRVVVLHSAGHSVLDDMVVRAALQWRARPGRAREVDFPMIFVLPQ